MDFNWTFQSQQAPAPQAAPVKEEEEETPEAAVIRDLTNQIHTNNAYFNSRDFAAIRKNKAPGFVYHRPAGDVAQGDVATAMNTDEYLAMFQAYISAYPEFHVTVNHLEITPHLENVHYEFAEIFQEMEITGAPPGITRQSFSINIARKIDGKWMLVSQRSLPGPGMGGD